MSDDLQHRIIAYLYDVAGGTEHREKAEALADELADAPQPALLLSEEERKAVSNLRDEAKQSIAWMCESGPDRPHDVQCYYHEECQRLSADIATIDNLLARSAPADSVVVRREVLTALTMIAKVHKQRCDDLYESEEAAIAEAEAALKGGE